jgi:glycerol-3-phosphate dehydrogenase
LPRNEWRKLSGIKTDGLQAVFEYYDGQTDDAQLTRAVLRSASSLGADIVYPTRFLSAARGSAGYQIDYQHHDQHQQCEATVLINAAGPWINVVRDCINPSPPQMEIELVQGAHLVLDRKFSDGVIYVEAPSDGRAVFIMPWKEGALVGTTETVFRGVPDDVGVRETEVAYLVETLEHYFPGHGAKVTNSFAGLRVLPADKASPFGRSRETTLLTERPDRPTYVGIYGGKLTAYRATAEKVVRLIRSSLPIREPRANSRTLRLE